MMKSFTRYLFFVMAFIFISTSIVDAEFYTWKDKDGVTHYSDTAPPVADQKYQTIEGSESRNTQEKPSPGSFHLPDNLGLLRYDGTKKSLKVILKAVIPYAEKGYHAARGIYECAGYGLALNLKDICQYDNLASTHEDEKLWWAAIEKNVKAGDVFYKTVVANSFEYRSGFDYYDGVKMFTEAAEEGYPDALCRLGFMFLKMKNENRAYECYSSAAEKGSIIANFRMGMKILNLNRRGRNIRKLERMPKNNRRGRNIPNLEWMPKNKREKAYDLFLKAAKGGYLPAMGTLATLYDREANIIYKKTVRRPFVGHDARRKKVAIAIKSNSYKEKAKKWRERASEVHKKREIWLRNKDMPLYNE